MQLCIFLSLSKLEYGRYRFIAESIIFRVTFSSAFLTGSNTIQFFLAGETTEINESAH